MLEKRNKAEEKIMKRYSENFQPRKLKRPNIIGASGGLSHSKYFPSEKMYLVLRT